MAKKPTMTLKTSNAVFECDNRAYEFARILRETADAVEHDVTSGPFPLGPLLADVATAVSAAQTRITTGPNVIISKAALVASTDVQEIAELEKVFAPRSGPVPARIEVERNHLLGLVSEVGTLTDAWNSEISVLALLDGANVTVVWDPHLGVGRIDLTEAAAAAFLKG